VLLPNKPQPELALADVIDYALALLPDTQLPLTGKSFGYLVYHFAIFLTLHLWFLKPVVMVE